jgi:hypothetical protein
MSQKETSTFIWKFFQNFRHNCPREKAQAFLKYSLGSESYPTPNINYEKSTIHQENWSRIYQEKAKSYLPFLRYLPGIRGVALCNSIALGTAKKNSDIDIFIVSAKHKIWTARIFATLFFQILGVRRHGKKKAGRFCLSFFVSEDALSFQNIALQPKDPYLAFWSASLLPVFGKKIFKTIAEKNKKFIKRNAGIIPRFEKELPTLQSGDSLFRTCLEFIFRQWFEKIIKKTLLKRTIQKKSMLPDSSGIIISENILKFHNRDKRKEFVPRKEKEHFLQTIVRTRKRTKKIVK